MFFVEFTKSYKCTKSFWTAGPRPVEIAVVQSIPVAEGLPCPVGKAFAVRYWLYFILTLVPGIKISIHGFPPKDVFIKENVLRNYTDLSMSVGNIDSWLSMSVGKFRDVAIFS